MNTLILYAHPNPKSFCHAILELTQEMLKQAGYTVDVRDLYALNFNPTLQGSDFEGFRSGKLPEDIGREQAFIRKADWVVVIHPIWWFGMPAILKGYIDRVFSAGFAYKYGPNGPEGLLKGKKVIILNTTGGGEDAYMNDGFRDAVIKAVDVGVFGFCGMDVAHHHFCFAVPMVSSEARKEMLTGIAQRLKASL